MGAFNTVIVFWTDSEGKSYDLKVQFKYGEVRQHVYRIGDSLKWGGNDVGSREFKRVVVDGVLDGKSKMANAPEDYEVHIVDNAIDKVVPATGSYDFVHAADTFIVIEE